MTPAPDGRPLVIFGNLASASMARHCIEHETGLRVAAFCVDAAYRTTDTFEDLPLLPFEELERWFPPVAARMVIPVGYQHINGLRRSRFENARQRGYTFITYVSPRASVWPTLKLGDNTLVYDQAIIQPYAELGTNCIVRSGANISHHSVVEDHVFIGAGVTMGGKCRIGEQAFIGVGAVLVDQVTIAPRTFVGAGAVVIRDTEPDGVYVGNPARRLPDRTARSVS